MVFDRPEVHDLLRSDDLRSFDFDSCFRIPCFFFHFFSNYAWHEYDDGMWQFALFSLETSISAAGRLDEGHVQSNVYSPKYQDLI